MLQQHLTHPLRDAAMNLAVHQRVVEHGAAIVDRVIADQCDLAGLRLDFDFGDMTAIGKRLRGVDIALGVEAFGNLALLRHLGSLGSELEQTDRAIGADHLEQTAAIGDVLVVGFEQLRREHPAFFHHRLDRAHDRGAGRDGRA